MRPDGYRPMTLGNGIRAAAARGPDRPAIVDGDHVLPYRTLVDRMDRVATMAQARFGLRPGDRAALIAPNVASYVEIVVGLADAGIIVATLSPRLARAELGAILDDCTPRLILVHPGCTETLDPAWGRDIPIVVLDGDYEALLASATPARSSVAVDETDAFALAYTSGTTGRPKGVLLSHRSRAITFMAMAAEYGCFGQDDRFLAIAPMCHGAGFVMAAAALFFGGTTVLFDAHDPEALLARLGQRDITGLFMVPTHFSRLFDLSAGVLARHRHHALKTIISNAAALPQPMKEAAIDHFGPGLLHETYGSTEAGIVTNIRPADLLRKPGSVGVPFAQMEIELRGADGIPVSDGTPGELFARGPTTCNGYWQRPEETREALVEGWVTVGDIAERDADGFFRIVDRKKDMVITGGLNVYPGEIEAVILGQPGVRDAAVVGLPDPEWGERLHAFVVPRAGAAIDQDVLIAACRDALAGYKVPRRVTLLDELPRNASGKILKRVLRQSATG